MSINWFWGIETAVTRICLLVTAVHILVQSTAAETWQRKTAVWRNGRFHFPIKSNQR
ncbi:MAG: hypothetical protein GY805_31995 [Chloroflexi bacterium]|nr:hypothetical protein [Chloroflexota bacterium]